MKHSAIIIFSLIAVYSGGIYGAEVHKLKLSTSLPGCPVERWLGFSNRTCASTAFADGAGASPGLRKASETAYTAWKFVIKRNSADPAQRLYDIKSSVGKDGKIKCPGSIVPASDSCDSSELIIKPGITKAGWKLVPKPGKKDEYNIIWQGRSSKCPRFLSAPKACSKDWSRLVLSGGDDGSGLQRWTISPSIITSRPTPLPSKAKSPPPPGPQLINVSMVAYSISFTGFTKDTFGPEQKTAFCKSVVSATNYLKSLLTCVVQSVTDVPPATQVPEGRRLLEVTTAYVQGYTAFSVSSDDPNSLEVAQAEANNLATTLENNTGSVFQAAFPDSTIVAEDVGVTSMSEPLAPTPESPTPSTSPFPTPIELPPIMPSPVYSPSPVASPQVSPTPEPIASPSPSPWQALSPPMIPISPPPPSRPPPSPPTPLMRPPPPPRLPQWRTVTVADVNIYQEARRRSLKTLTSSYTNDRFGTRLALSPDSTVMAIGAEEYRTPNTAYIGRVDMYYRQDASSTTWLGPVTIDSPYQSQSSVFGFSLDSSSNGEVIAIGAPNYSSNKGAVFTFQRTSMDNNTAPTWEFKEQLTPLNITDSIGDAYFGFDVSIDDAGTTLAAGHPTYNSVNWGTGDCWVYQRASTADPWGAPVRLNAPGFQSVSVSPDGQLIVVGSSVTADVYPFYGIASLYTKDQFGTWSTALPLVPADAAEFPYLDEYGYSVAVAALGSLGCVVAVGDPANNIVFVYDVAANGTASDPSVFTLNSGVPAGAYFGDNVDLNAAGTVLIIGAPARLQGNSLYGKVYYYTREAYGGDWNETAPKIFTGPETAVSFGMAVTLNREGNVFGTSYEYDLSPELNGAEKRGIVEVMEYF